MKKLQMKNNKGITLVALVVTIIILIILAGISINMLVGTDGLITKAKQAKENIELAEIEEQEKLNTLYDRLATGTGPATMYEVIADYQRQINELQTELDILKGNLGENAATSDKILKNYTAYVNGQLVTGTIEDRGTLNWNPSESTSMIIEPGYYSGGTISTENAYNAGLTAGREGYYTQQQYDDNYTAGYNAGVEAGKSQFSFTGNYFAQATAKNVGYGTVYFTLNISNGTVKFTNISGDVYTSATHPTVYTATGVGVYSR